MDRSQLAARIQDILKGRPRPAAPPLVDAPLEAGPHAGSDEGVVAGVLQRSPVADEEAAFAARCSADEASARVLDVLGATLEQGAGGSCIVVDRDYEGHRGHGRRPVSGYAAVMNHPSAGLGLLLDPRPRSGLFFDLETTGLSGGAGTYAFLVGFGYFDGDGFHTRQFFLRGFGEERALLHAVTAFVRGFETPEPLPTASCPLAVAGVLPPADCQPALVTYNGKAFDLPLIETRYQMQRLGSPFGELPHLDLLFPARRLWRRRLVRDGSNRRALLSGGFVSPDDDRASCALTVLEEDILGLVREDDVPGWEIPGRYFGYARTGDARGLEAVLEHNRLDLVSLGALTAVVLEMVAGLVPARDRYEVLALARLLEYLGRASDAERCYVRAAEPDGLFEAALDGCARAEALRWLAVHRRRSRRFGEAAETWQRLLDIKGLSAEMRREGLEALAIHAEHRAKDLSAARRFALGALDLSRGSRYAPEVEHRLGRLTRKIGHVPPGTSAAPVQPTFPVED